MDARRVDVNGTGLHVLEAGQGPAVVLLHGWPVTSHHWREVIPVLAEEYRVIAPDLRGLGDSERPPSGYDKRTLAKDINALVDTLGVEQFALVGHDFGGTVASAVAADRPEQVTHLVVIEELLPGLPVAPSLANPRYPRWHNALHAAAGVPELLIAGREREYHGLFWGLTAEGRAMPPEVIEEYARTYLQPDALRVGLAYYRTATEDAAHFAELTRRPLATPTLTIAGDQAMAGAVAASVSQLCRRMSSVVLDHCGHYPAEEHPRAVADLIRIFGEPTE
jgi:pimeloyl-ACP methyl ester carboxylesterase